MDTLQQLRNEYTEEYHITKKFFGNYPDGKNDYAPHEKSMKMGQLATHIAEIFGWPKVMLETSDLDLATAPAPVVLKHKDQLLEKLDAEYNAGMDRLKEASEEDLNPEWSLSMNGQKLMHWTTYGALRHGLNQITHHRAQLGVYFRLLNIEVPGSYGPSADVQSF